MSEQVTRSEVAERLGVAPESVSRWNKQAIIPAPIRVTPSGPLWDWAVVKKWAVDTGRLKDDD